MKTLGIDTSNYATSLAVYDSVSGLILASVKLPLPVKEGELGLRQQDAVFAHIKSIPLAFEQLAAQTNISDITAVGVSCCPRDVEGSYMPCFLVGLSSGKSIGYSMNIPVYEVSHQAGHIMAALYGTGFSTIDKKDFYAFHVSGGTTDSLICHIDGADLDIRQAGTSLDLFAGQVVDRVGAMLGLSFPAGEQLSALAEQSDTDDHAKVVIKGLDCNLSGLQNKCQKLLEQQQEPAYIARYCLNSVAETIVGMTKSLMAHDTEKDIIYAGGVMSSSVIRRTLSNYFPTAHFCQPVWLSADNAVGTAILAARAEAYK